MSDPTYIIGIDLGTTNSVVAYTKAELGPGQTPDIQVMEVPQTVSPGVVENQNMLPSFVLAPGPHDVPEDALELPWSDESDLSVGVFAKQRGAEIPHRLITSAKSWLCHPLVDRNKPILPWKSPEDSLKLSPVEASACILEHIRQAWNHTMARTDDGFDEMLKMEHQEILLTVPASFDAVARELTVNAAIHSGLSHVTLLEEPQAAFYAWIHDTGDRWRDKVKEGDLVLVCDVGGGTSDFSLIQVGQSDGDLVLERIAVGDHLLVGGDNMDLTLAHMLAQRLAKEGTKVNTRQLQTLWHSCRNAKERLFEEKDQETVPLSILGSGSSLIGDTIRTELSRSDVEEAILDGFFLTCPRDATPESQSTVGLREMGLSYEADPAITRHLAQFLRHLDRHDTPLATPSAILFNGGVMKAGSLRSRILDVVNSWQSEADQEQVRELATGDYDLGVSKGAVYYGLARLGQGVRIRSGLGKSYYLGIAAAIPAVPGFPAPVKALCVAPFGMEEGTTADLLEEEFVLVVGEPVKFEFLGASARFDDTVGTLVEEWEEGDILPIATLEATLEGELGTIIPVVMEIKVTEVGTLEVWCVSKEDDQKWKLEFNVREREDSDV